MVSLNHVNLHTHSVWAVCWEEQKSEPYLQQQGQNCQLKDAFQLGIEKGQTKMLFSCSILGYSQQRQFPFIASEGRCLRWEGAVSDEAGLEVGIYLPACPPGLGGKRNGDASLVQRGREKNKKRLFKIFDSYIFPTPPSLQTSASLLRV